MSDYASGFSSDFQVGRFGKIVAQDFETDSLTTSVLNFTDGTSMSRAVVVAQPTVAGAVQYSSGTASLAADPGVLVEPSAKRLKTVDGAKTTQLDPNALQLTNTGVVLTAQAQTTQALVGTQSSHPLQLVTNNVVRATIGAAGAASFAGALVADSLTSATSATAASVFANQRLQTPVDTDTGLETDGALRFDSAGNALQVFHSAAWQSVGPEGVDAVAVAPFTANVPSVNQSILTPATNYVGATDVFDYAGLLTAITNASPFDRLVLQADITIGASEATIVINKSLCFEVAAGTGIKYEAPNKIIFQITSGAEVLFAFSNRAIAYSGSNNSSSDSSILFDVTRGCSLILAGGTYEYREVLVSSSHATGGGAPDPNRVIIDNATLAYKRAGQSSTNNFRPIWVRGGLSHPQSCVSVVNSTWTIASNTGGSERIYGIVSCTAESGQRAVCTAGLIAVAGCTMNMKCRLQSVVYMEGGVFVNGQERGDLVVVINGNTIDAGVGTVVSTVREQLFLTVSGSTFTANDNFFNTFDRVMVVNNTMDRVDGNKGLVYLGDSIFAGSADVILYGNIHPPYAAASSGTARRVLSRDGLIRGPIAAAPFNTVPTRILFQKVPHDFGVFGPP
jgi:hypothetical protein